MFFEAEIREDSWVLRNHWGHEFRLPCLGEAFVGDISIGVMGTGTRHSVKGIKKYLMADMFSSLHRPLYILDARRNGVGAMGSWSPKEFASEIPARIAGQVKYEFLHLPALAPSLSLLDEYRKGGPAAAWRVFRDRYLDELSVSVTRVAQAFVEAASIEGGLAVFICAEPDHPDFMSLDEAHKDAVYCHRFTLAKLVAASIEATHCDTTVKCVHLDLCDYVANPQGYQPRDSTL